jgi:uncharacterized protein YhfF
MHPSVRALWRAYLHSIGETPATTSKTFDTWAFGDHAALANELVELVLCGEKRATTPSVWELEAADEAQPAPGDFHVVTDAAGIARCVIRTTCVDVVPFNEVDAEYALLEGEGDKSLEFWRRSHWAYYRRVLADTAYQPSPDMSVICQQFEVVFVPTSDQ